MCVSECECECECVCVCVSGPLEGPAQTAAEVAPLPPGEISDAAATELGWRGGAKGDGAAGTASLIPCGDSRALQPADRCRSYRLQTKGASGWRFSYQTGASCAVQPASPLLKPSPVRGHGGLDSFGQARACPSSKYETGPGRASAA